MGSAVTKGRAEEAEGRGRRAAAVAVRGASVRARRGRSRLPELRRCSLSDDGAVRGIGDDGGRRRLRLGRPMGGEVVERLSREDEERPSFETAASISRRESRSSVTTRSRSAPARAAFTVAPRPSDAARSRCTARARATRSRTVSDDSPWRAPVSADTSTGGTATCTSMRSSNGPLSRER
jgi:hypothetical protein